MKQIRGTSAFGLCVAGTLAVCAGQSFGQTACGGSVGPDVIVGDLPNTANFAPVGGIDAMAMATTSCNLGTANLLWNAFPANTHPAIAQTMYRYSTVAGAGRFEQIGMSWLKHGFTALTGNVCCVCNDPSNGSLLGVGCSDPYTAGRNASQGGLGPHWQINAHTGAYPTGGPATGTGGSGNVFRRLQFNLSDVVATAGGSAATTRFFGESQYVSPDDAAAGNQNNNASYREFAVTGTAADWTVNFSTAPGSVANTSRENPAVRAWKLIDPAVTQTDVQVPGDGLFIVSSKATSLGGGMYHYEYAIYNMNADRCGGKFLVPMPAAATVTNIGFSSPVYRDGDGDANISFASTAWTNTRTSTELAFGCEPQATNIRANAIRWGSTYNFRFDANVAPVAGGNVSVGLWKTGSPAAIFAAAQSPGTYSVPIIAGGSASPSSAAITSSTLLTVAVTPATNPLSTGIAVVGNLSTINGSTTQTFYDNGTNGDVTAGDNIFSFLATLAEPLTTGGKSIPFTVTDAQARSTPGSIELTLTAAPSGRCCGTSCSIISAYQCVQSGGTYGGDNTTCGGSSYTITTGGSAYSTISASGTEALTAGSCDDCSEQVALPFAFNHFGNNYNSLRIHSNGYLQFTGDDAVYTNSPIPSTDVPNNCIYPMWDDLNLVTTGTIYYKTVGSAPNRQFIVEWYHAPQYDTTTSENFQAVLFETSNNVEFRYGAITPENGAGDYTIGIENSTGTVAYSIPGALIGAGNTSRLVSFVPPSNPCPPPCGTSDFDGDGDSGTDADIEAFFACLGGNCCGTCFPGGSDFNGDGDSGTDSDIESFFSVLGGAGCVY